MKLKGAISLFYILQHTKIGLFIGRVTMHKLAHLCVHLSSPMEKGLYIAIHSFKPSKLKHEYIAPQWTPTSHRLNKVAQHVNIHGGKLVICVIKQFLLMGTKVQLKLDVFIQQQS